MYTARKGVSALGGLSALVVLCSSSGASAAEPGTPQRAIFPQNCQVTLTASALVFSEFELNDGCVIKFDPKLKAVEMTIMKLTLHGRSKIDLASPIPKAPSGKAQTQTPTQAQPEHNTGHQGFPGGDGDSGSDGIGLTLNIQQWEAADGSLWIRTDGQEGGDGGKGGNGAKGSAGPWTGTHCADGGDGGTGGQGGKGGKGGNTSTVVLTVGGSTIAPTQASTKYSPSDWPDEVVQNFKVIVPAGAPGKGGKGGPGGPGGNPGEGHRCHFPATDAHPGNHGGVGPIGSNGTDGAFQR